MHWNKNKALHPNIYYYYVIEETNEPTQKLLPALMFPFVQVCNKIVLSKTTALNNFHSDKITKKYVNKRCSSTMCGTSPYRFSPEGGLSYRILEVRLYKNLCESYELNDHHFLIGYEMSPEEGQHEYDEVQADLDQMDAEVRRHYHKSRVYQSLSKCSSF